MPAPMAYEFSVKFAGSPVCTRVVAGRETAKHAWVSIFQSKNDHEMGF
jgi:hypothetical protein